MERVASDVAYSPPEAENGVFVDRLNLTAEIDALNAALSSVVWLADESDAESIDGFVPSSLVVTATDRDGASSSATIAMRGAAANDAPRVQIEPRSPLHVEEDQGWVSVLANASIFDADDDVVTASISARTDAELEVHVVQTHAHSSRSKHSAVHVVTLLNKTNTSAPVVGGSFQITVDWTEATLFRPWLLPAGIETATTTTPISFDAVAKVSDERRGRAASVRREAGAGASDDLTGQTIEAKLLALVNIRAAGIEVVVSRDDYATTDPFDATDIRYDGESPAPVSGSLGHTWRITFAGAPPALTNAPLAVTAPLLLPSTRLVRTLLAQPNASTGARCQRSWRNICSRRRRGARGHSA